MPQAQPPARTSGKNLTGVLLRTQPDERLGALAGEGSKPAFDELVRRHRSALVGFAGRIAPSERADDVVQESMVKAYLALQRGDCPENPRAWLFKIVRNTALNDQRDWRVHEHLDENYDGVEQPPEAAERRRQLKDLVLALRELPEAQREAIVQRELEGKGHSEIASAMRLSPGAVRQLIFRARDALRAGVGALVPIQVLRLVALAGADPASAGAGAAGAGIGLSAAKVGLGAVLATGAVVAGTEVGKEVGKGDRGNRGAIAQEATAVVPAAATDAPTEARSARSSRGNKSGSAAKTPTKTLAARRRPLPPPPPRHHRYPRHQPSSGSQVGPEPQGGHGGQGGRQQGTGGHHQPPPTGSGTQTGTQSPTGEQPPPPPSP